MGRLLSRLLSRLLGTFHGHEDKSVHIHEDTSSCGNQVGGTCRGSAANADQLVGMRIRESLPGSWVVFVEESLMNLYNPNP